MEYSTIGQMPKDKLDYIGFVEKKNIAKFIDYQV